MLLYVLTTTCTPKKILIILKSQFNPRTYKLTHYAQWYTREEPVGWIDPPLALVVVLLRESEMNCHWLCNPEIALQDDTIFLGDDDIWREVTSFDPPFWIRCAQTESPYLEHIRTSHSLNKYTIFLGSLHLIVHDVSSFWGKFQTQIWTPFCFEFFITSREKKISTKKKQIFGHDILRDSALFLNREWRWNYIKMSFQPWVFKDNRTAKGRDIALGRHLAY